jgi:serine/threonine protein kinase
LSDALEHRYGELTVETDFGWAVRYRARSKDSDLHIAVFRPEAERIESARRDAAKLEKVKNPHVAALRDVLDLDDGRLVLELEAPSGPTLAERVLEGTSKVGELVDRICQMADGLRALHDAGLVHGDLEPENVVITEARGATLTGLVLNHAFDRESRQSTSSEKRVLRSLAYMAPEQARGERASAASDIYSLGAIAYSAIAGRRPYTQEDAAELRRSIAAAGAPHLSEVRSEVRGALAYAVDRAMAREPSRRFPDAEAMRKALRSSLVVAPKLASLELASRFSPKSPDPPKVTGRGSYRPRAPTDPPGKVTVPGFPAPAHDDEAPIDLVRVAPRKGKGGTLLGLKLPADEKRFGAPAQDDTKPSRDPDTRELASHGELAPKSTSIAIPRPPAVPSELLGGAPDRLPEGLAPLEPEPTIKAAAPEELSESELEPVDPASLRPEAKRAPVPTPRTSIARVELVKKSTGPIAAIETVVSARPPTPPAGSRPAIALPSAKPAKDDDAVKTTAPQGTMGAVLSDARDKALAAVAAGTAVSDTPVPDARGSDDPAVADAGAPDTEPNDKPADLKAPITKVIEPDAMKPDPKPIEAAAKHARGPTTKVIDRNALEPATSAPSSKRGPREPSSIELTDDTLEELHVREITPPPVPHTALIPADDEDSERLSLGDMEPMRPSQAERLDTKQLTAPPPPPHGRDSDPLPRGTDTWHVRKPKSTSRRWIGVAIAAGALFLIGLWVGRLVEDDEAVVRADLQRPITRTIPAAPVARAPEVGESAPEVRPRGPATTAEAEPADEPPSTEIRLVGLPEDTEVLLNSSRVDGNTVVLTPRRSPNVLEFRGIDAPSDGAAQAEAARAAEAREESQRAEAQREEAEREAQRQLAQREERPNRRARIERAQRRRERAVRMTERMTEMAEPVVAAAERRRPTVVTDPGF